MTPEGRPRELMLKALLELRLLRVQVRELEAERHQAIAVVGLGCRFPGAATPSELWRLLAGGIEAVSPAAERWPGADAGGARGGFITGVDLFDPLLFGISPREAANMDPQQRLLLEVVWETLERAAIAPDRLRNKAVGVFVGQSTDDYAWLGGGYGRDGLGSARSVTAGRVSYVLGLRGPALQLDTACSSSLVALHLASQSLRLRECDLALVAGVNLMLSQETTAGLARLQALSPTGRCRTFDAAADGFVRGEGCGVLLLERHADAIAAGRQVQALILGSAVNHDGPSSGLTVPSQGAQEELLRRALAAARLAPSEVDYLEAHGTGTQLGDPVELLAVARAFAGRGAEPLLVGSIKTNIGHLEAAAGVAGVIKTVLALQHAEVPPHLHFTTPNPHVPWPEMPLRVAAELTPWPSTGRPRHAGVSAFGMSGTNAHVVLAQAPVVAEEATVAGVVERPVHLLALSARTPRALAELAGRWAEHLRRHPELRAADVAHTALVGRSRLSCRLALVAADTAQLAAGLEAAAEGRPVDGLATGRATVEPPRLALLCTGQGSPPGGRVEELARCEPTFRQALDRCAAVLDGELGCSLWDRLSSCAVSAADEGAPVGEPATVALEWSLAQVWRAWGVEPGAVFGHDAGELAAAIVAGVFTLEDGLRVALERDRCQGERGRLAAVIGSLPMGSPDRLLISGGTGAPVADEASAASWWCRPPGEAAHCEAGLAYLWSAGYRSFVELAPRPQLVGACQSLLDPGGESRWLASLRPAETASRTLLTSLGALFVAGVPVDAAGLDRGHNCRRLELPTYPFERQRYWFRGGSEELAARLRLELDARVAAPELAVYWHCLAEMEELTVDYVLEALREMGWDATAGERVEAGELAGRLGVCAMHGRLFDRLLAMLCEAGVLEPASGGWRVVVPGSRPAAREHRARMLASCPQAAVELEVLDRCGTGLAAVLRGAEQGLQSLLPDADLSLLTRLYEDAPFARVMNEALADVVAALAAGRRRLAVLEVGAGTGASTAWLLPRLGEDAAYTFSDIGPLFLKRARERFVADPRLAFQTFDLERDPAEQSLPLHGFDLVIAANVLHATCNLRASIDHVTRLLAPGGALVALETTAQQRWVDLFAGFAGGWWRFSDQDLRPDHPLLEPSAWRRLLEERGFAEVAVLEPRWHGQAMVARPAILIADGAPVRPGAATTAPGEPAVLVPAPPPGQPAVGALAEAPVEVWTDLLAATPAALRRRRLEELLTAEVGAVLELARHQWPEADLGLFELGMDSLTAIELKTRLQRRLGLVLPSSLIFDHPSVRALAGFLLGCVADSARPPAAVEDPPAGGADDAAAVDGGAGEPAAADGGLQVVLERELEALEELLARNGGPRHA